MLGFPYFPPNLVHIALAQADPRMLTSPDGKSVQVSLAAIAALLRECAAESVRPAK